jgi:hypothetical protein
MIHKDDLEEYARRFGLAVLIALAAILFITPLLLRAVEGAPLTPGAESYTQLRHAELLTDAIAGTGAIGWDNITKEAFTPAPYALLLAALQLFGVPWLLPLLLIVALILLLWYALPRVMTSRALIAITIGFFIIAPTTARLATRHAPETLALCFLGIAIIVFPKRFVTAGIALLAAVLTAPAFAAPAVLIIACIALVRKHRAAAVCALCALALGVAWHLAWSGSAALFALAPRFHGIVYELGVPAGISVFLIVFALYGLITRIGENTDLVLWTVLLCSLAIAVPILLPYAALALCVFAARGTYDLLTDPWQLDLLQQILIILLMCTWLFLGITTVRGTVQQEPTAAFAHTMITLRNQDRPGGVLTSPASAPLVEYFAHRSATLAEDTPQTTVENAFSRSSAAVYPLLEATDTSYILITREMQLQDVGILFLLQNTERFVTVQETPDLTLWYYISSEKIPSTTKTMPTVEQQNSTTGTTKNTTGNTTKATTTANNSSFLIGSKTGGR